MTITIRLAMREKSPEGIERQIADQEIARREAVLYQENSAIDRYSSAKIIPD